MCVFRSNGQMMPNYSYSLFFCFSTLGKCNKASITIKPYRGKKYPVGINLTLDCECKSSATKRIRWLRNGVKVNPKKKMITLDGKRLILNNATYADSGNYTCKVTVDGSHASWSRTLEFWGMSRKDLNVEVKCIFVTVIL